jgi:hypothetical protein
MATVEFRLLIPYFRECGDKHQVATYEGMKEAAGVDVQAMKRHVIDSVLAYVKREYGYVFECIANVGYRRVETEMIADRQSKKRLNQMRSTTRRWRKDLDYASAHANLGASAFGSYCQVSFLERSLDEKTQDKIHAVGVKTAKKLDWRKDLNAANKIAKEAFGME